ncbi:MAG: hypothetical protein ACFCBW_02985 [Candidatus Competibacterales bacterium]
MGGNALKTVPTRRYAKDEYLALWRERVAPTLGELFPAARAALIPAYAAKADFGDMDVLLEADPLPLDWVDAAAKAFQSREVVRNEVVSLDVMDLQVDLIPTPAEHFAFSMGYFSYNDLGNLMGRLFHKMGFKFGHRGLFWPLRDAHDHVQVELLVTRDFATALALGGYDYPRWCQGFATLEEVFAFAAATPYFHPQLFLTDQVNHRGRVRSRKRPSYRQFLTWCEAQGPTLPRFDHPADKGVWLQRAFAGVPGLAARHGQLVGDLERQQRARRRFGGQRIQALTGLQGPALGRFMASLQGEFADQRALLTWVDSQSEAQLEAWIQGRFGRWSTTGGDGT